MERLLVFLIMVTACSPAFGQIEFDNGGFDNGGIILTPAPYGLDIENEGIVNPDFQFDPNRLNIPGAEYEEYAPTPDAELNDGLLFDYQNLENNGWVIDANPEVRKEELIEAFRYEPPVDNSPTLNLVRDALPRAHFKSSQLERLLENTLPWTEILDGIPMSDRYQIGIQLVGLPENDVNSQQTVPGHGVDDTPGYEGFDVANGGPDLLVTPGVGLGGNIKKPGDECQGHLCGLPKRQEIEFDQDRERADIEYIVGGYPEVVFTATFSGNDLADPNGPIKSPRCTATMLTPQWAVTALHCLDFTRKIITKDGKKIRLDREAGEEISFEKYFDRETVPNNSGWSKLTIKEEFSFTIRLLSAQLKREGKVGEIFIPYSGNEDVTSTFWGAPTKDLALYKLVGKGLGHKVNELPFIDRRLLANKSYPISFSGFGWSNTNCAGGDGASGGTFKDLLKSSGLACLKQAAFNFVDAVKKFGTAKYPMISWKQGDDGADGGPCRFDSGGPVYAGFNRGFKNDPRVVVGVVSGLINTSNATGTDLCMDPRASGVAEQIHFFAEDICQFTNNDPNGCTTQN